MNPKTTHLTLLTVMVFFVPYSSFAQNEVEVTYEHAVMGFTKTSKLLISDTAFLYQSHQQSDERINEKGWEFFLPKKIIDWYYNRAQNFIIASKEREKPKTLFYSEWAAEELEWEIHDEVKEINGYKVQKATTKPFDVVKYYVSNGEIITLDGDLAVAWFAVDLPFSVGPEGYYGLPGLILQLEYTKRKEYFKLDKLEFKYVEITPPKNVGIIISKDEFYNFYKIDPKWLKQQQKLLKKANK